MSYIVKLNATPDSSLNTSRGVLNPKHFLSLLLSDQTALFTSSFVKLLKFVPFGKYLLKSSLVFSLVPLVSLAPLGFLFPSLGKSLVVLEWQPFFRQLF